MFSRSLISQFILRFGRSVGVMAPLAIAITAQTRADFILPDAWARPAALSPNPIATFQGWEAFSSGTLPNNPNGGTLVMGPGFGGTASDAWSPINAAGNATVTETTGLAFITGGNLYNASAATSISTAIPNNIDAVSGDSTAGWTTLLVQIRTRGTEINPSTLLVNGIAPEDSVELSRVALGGFGGFQVDTWHQFKIAGNRDFYTLTFGSPGPHMSLDRLSIDTAWNETAFLQSQAFSNVVPVPEPGTWAVLAGAAIVGEIIRRRRMRGRDAS